LTLVRAATIAYLALTCAASAADLPDAIAAKGETEVLQAHAVGAQIYECVAAQSDGKLTWQFREPIAALFRDGDTVGLHYVGPTWELEESLIVGEDRTSAPAPSGGDIPWLKLEVTTAAEEGPLKDVTAVQRINTVGGTLEGPCDKAGDLRGVPYAADYVFLKKK
jgi:hypothetical protein